MQYVVRIVAEGETYLVPVASQSRAEWMVDEIRRHGWTRREGNAAVHYNTVDDVEWYARD